MQYSTAGGRRCNTHSHHCCLQAEAQQLQAELKAARLAQQSAEDQSQQHLECAAKSEAKVRSVAITHGRVPNLPFAELTHHFPPMEQVADLEALVARLQQQLAAKTEEVREWQQHHQQEVASLRTEFKASHQKAAAAQQEAAACSARLTSIQAKVRPTTFPTLSLAGCM